MVIAYLKPENIVTNLAQMARPASYNRDSEATSIAVDLLEKYYRADNAAFAPENLKPLSFRDGPMLRAVATLEAESQPSTEQSIQLTVLKEAIELEEQLLLNAQLVPVVPDINHWDFTRPSDMDSPFVFDGPKNRPLISALEEARYAGLLSNPHDPTQPRFDAKFVLDPQRLSQQADVISEKIGLDRDRLLQTVFVNAAQVLGRRIPGTPEGQVGPKFWTDLAAVAKQALTIK